MSKLISPSDWNSEYVEKLWNWVSANPHMQETYFTYQVGRGIVNFLKFTGKLTGKVLDFGSGTGNLIQHLITENVECYATDSSAESIRIVNEKFSKSPNWKAATIVTDIVTDFPDDYFDVITCVETLEHLPDALVDKLIAELKRIVKSTGIILITTPYKENLASDHIYCPFCDSEFHRWQHYRSIDENFMRELMLRNNLNTVFCRNTDFNIFQQNETLPLIKDLTINILMDWMRTKKNNFAEKFKPRPFPTNRNLYYKLIKSRNGRHLVTVVSKQI